MEGNNSISQPFEMLIRIREFTRSLIKGMCAEQSSFVVHIDRFRNYCTDSSGYCSCSSDTAKGKEVITLQRECHVHRLDVLLRVLLIVQQLLQENKHGSKRDIFYMHPSVFREQSVVDRAINDICILLQCSRHNLNVVSVGKGLVMGWIRFSEAGRKYDCINHPNCAHPVPVNVEEVKDIMSVAKYILIVEKESVFQRLANDQFCKKNQCIVITGRGYPDVPTRRFLRLIIEKLCLPTYCLVDCDPYGFDILTTYRFGSMQMAYDAKFLRITKIHWIGVFLSDVDKFSLPKHCLLPLTKEDKSRTEALLRRCYLEREVPEWRLELEFLLQRGVKFEIEALSAHSLSFLSDVYVPSKIQGELYM
ncbi:Meiotic recombination protein SPO11-1 [Heracleum sosnowskyi]|uniref:DNA topoisomerase (ATP-hydrolyzing) n=1 Tax=Heracleum sosnowskyi TaxID=360622 RepID=A0AAD8N6F8_9APIA|nr:Meiotic recombination protein SPO11-1 [Heracleum sosnowskyi]